MTEFLEGRTTGAGVFEDRFGRLRSRFTFEMNGNWRDGRFVLDELFKYANGEHETRAWTFVSGSDGTFRATCPACVGEAFGRSYPDMVRSKYRFRLPVSGRSVPFDFDDRLYRIDTKTAINRIRVSKWGISVGDLSLYIERQSDAKAAA